MLILLLISYWLTAINKPLWSSMQIFNALHISAGWPVPAQSRLIHIHPDRTSFGSLHEELHTCSWPQMLIPAITICVIIWADERMIFFFSCLSWYNFSWITSLENVEFYIFSLPFYLFFFKLWSMCVLYWNLRSYKCICLQTHTHTPHSHIHTHLIGFGSHRWDLSELETWQQPRWTTDSLREVILLS